MGNYITFDDLEYRMGNTRLSNLSQGRDDATTYVNYVINRAESIIDGYASVLYVTPVPASPMVQDWAMCISEFELYKNSLGGDIPLKYKTSYESVIALLKSMSLGELIPPDTDDDSLVGKGNNQGKSIDVVSDNAMVSDIALYGSAQDSDGY